MDQNNNKTKKFHVSPAITSSIRIIVGIAVLAWMIWRFYDVIFITAEYGADTWVKFAFSGLIIGGMYALIAVGYTLVYGILFMINFAHGEVMVIGAFGGYFVFELLNAITRNSRRW